MKPTKARTRYNHCQMLCPYLNPYEHPFNNHTAWCMYLLKELFWYDGAWQCHCKTEEPDEELVKLFELGYTGNEHYKGWDK